MPPIESQVKIGRADPPHRGRDLRRATRKRLVARLRAEVDELREKLARAEAWAEMVEDECDALRAVLGMREVPA